MPRRRRRWSPTRTCRARLPPGLRGAPRRSCRHARTATRLPEVPRPGATVVSRAAERVETPDREPAEGGWLEPFALASVARGGPLGGAPPDFGIELPPVAEPPRAPSAIGCLKRLLVLALIGRDPVRDRSAWFSDAFRRRRRRRAGAVTTADSRYGRPVSSKSLRGGVQPGTWRGQVGARSPRNDARELPRRSPYVGRPARSSRSPRPPHTGTR